MEIKNLCFVIFLGEVSDVMEEFVIVLIKLQSVLMILFLPTFHMFFTEILGLNFSLKKS